MIASMTGFAAATEESPQGNLAVELKTVNHRYLEFQTRIPEEFRPLEPAMREAVAARLTRGKVDCRVTFTPAPSAKRTRNSPQSAATPRSTPLNCRPDRSRFSLAPSTERE